MNETSCYIRFFHAAADTEALQVSVDDASFIPSLPFRTVSGYGPVKCGFVTITLSGTRTRRVYLQKTLPFFLSIKYTIAIIQTVNGLDLRQMYDYMCPLLPDRFGCIRAANLAYGSQPMDFFLYGNKLMFTDVGFKEVTPFKPLRPGEYGFYLTPTQDEENPLVSVLTDIEAGNMYTMCVLNGTWGPDAIDVMVLSYDDTIPEIQPR
ncbi:DUF4397 domain-containing protein [Lacrimispora sp. NSJ-141]|uniref:DUF4397 domain-containing protein n=1 Tax=Lientehia hominis TaxID=2897778 RepID=A0AAP2RI11_9FIRM|nr:DUF4397 domain-containing protein [Lientehia hominis]MCD2491205.1 DUF4397 domain-containing protein [Lientehia hominis]